MYDWNDRRLFLLVGVDDDLEPRGNCYLKDVQSLFGGLRIKHELPGEEETPTPDDVHARSISRLVGGNL